MCRHDLAIQRAPAATCHPNEQRGWNNQRNASVSHASPSGRLCVLSIVDNPEAVLGNQPASLLLLLLGSRFKVIRGDSSHGIPYT